MTVAESTVDTIETSAGRRHDRKPKRFSCHSTFAGIFRTLVLPYTLVGARNPRGF
jgi:hypothetical protein